MRILYQEGVYAREGVKSRYMLNRYIYCLHHVYSMIKFKQ